MAGYRYSLALCQVNITYKGSTKAFGGQGKMIGSISVSRKNDRFSAEGDATGGFVINESLDVTGTCTISIKQFAPLVSTLTNMFNDYETEFSNELSSYQLENSADSSDLTISDDVNDTLGNSAKIQIYYMGNIVATCEGCYLNMPELNLEEENGTRDFVFECGSVKFEALDSKERFF